MSRRNVFIVIALLLLVVVSFAPPLRAYNGGVSPGNYQYGAPTCHSKQSSSTIQMSASNYTPDPGASVTVTVTVTGGEASNSPLGVMIVSATTSSNSLPSNDGWAIVSDPTGTTTYNYYETESYTGSLSATWTLNAPTINGTYKLYAREVHGNGETYTNRFVSGISFEVGITTVPTGFSAKISSPGDGDEVSGNIIVNADITPLDTVSYAVLKVDGVLVENKTATPYAWSLDTAIYADGQHILNLEAVNATGVHATDQITITVNNGGETEEMLAWVVTMGVGIIVILTIITVAIVAVLLIRKKLMESKKEGK